MRALLPHLPLGLAAHDPRCVAGDQKYGYALAAGGRRVTTSHHDEQVGTVGVRDVGLAPTQHPGAIGLTRRFGLQRGGVRAGLRLREGEGGEDVATGNAGQVCLLLIFRTADQNGAAA